MGEHISQTPENIDQLGTEKQKLRRFSSLISDYRMTLGNYGVVLSLGFESLRAKLVNPYSDPIGNLENIFLNKPIAEPILSQSTANPYLYEFLQSTGDAMWGYNFSFLSYTGLSCLETISKRRIPEKLKVGVSLGISMGIIALVETGMFRELITLGPDSGQIILGTLTPDIKDIIGGTLGPGVWLGLNHLGKRLNRFQQIKSNEDNNL